MKTAPRRLVFQLVSLFDLLIIIVFAQYFDLELRSRAQTDELRHEVVAADRRHQTEARLFSDADQIRRLLSEDLERISLEHEAQQAEAARTESELAAELESSRNDLARLGALVADLFDLPGDVVDKLLKSRTPEEAARIRKSLRELAANRGAQAVRHILTLAELEKRCDIWQIHIGDDNTYLMEADERKFRFRAESSERFEGELFKQYKSLPQPKNLVLILLSWGDADLRFRTAAIDGTERAADRMRADTDRRTRFEYAVLGFIPSPETSEHR